MIALFNHPTLAALAIIATPFAITALGKYIIAPTAYAIAGAPVMIVRGIFTGQWP